MKVAKRSRFKIGFGSVKGKVLPPFILWMLGLPAGVCVLLWLFFFRG